MICFFHRSAPQEGSTVHSFPVNVNSVNRFRSDIFCSHWSIVKHPNSISIFTDQKDCGLREWEIPVPFYCCILLSWCQQNLELLERVGGHQEVSWPPSTKLWHEKVHSLSVWKDQILLTAQFGSGLWESMLRLWGKVIQQRSRKKTKCTAHR